MLKDLTKTNELLILLETTKIPNVCTLLNEAVQHGKQEKIA